MLIQTLMMLMNFVQLFPSPFCLLFTWQRYFAFLCATTVIVKEITMFSGADNSALWKIALAYLINQSINQNSFIATSGVQRLLDARGQRGSWMPSNISIRLLKFLTTSF